jgi:thioredoxin-related protein
MLIIEDPGCLDCDEFHDSIFSDKRVQAELQTFTIVRINASSDAEIIDPAGNATTAGDLVREHQVIYRPGILLFDEGALVRRADSLIYPHHLSLSLRYVGRGYHRTMAYDTFSEQRTEEMLAAGIDIDLGPPQTGSEY